MTLPLRFMPELQFRRMAEGERLQSILIDVRSREEYIREYVKGASNIPHHDPEYYRDPRFAALFQELPAGLVRMPYEEFYQVLK